MVFKTFLFPFDFFMLKELAFAFIKKAGTDAGFSKPFFFLLRYGLAFRRNRNRFQFVVHKKH